MQLIEAWSPAVLPIAIAVLLIIAPGLVVIVSGWGFRRLGLLFLAPAASVALYAGSSIIAPLIGLEWTLLPPAMLTIVVASVAFAIRARGAERRGTVTRRSTMTALIAFGAAGLTIAVQFMRAFAAPENIAQKFDNILHLNTIQYALQTRNASMFHIGDVSDVAFYPNGWHSLTTLVAQVSGADVPVAVNAANLAIGAVLWTASSLALAWALFRGRRSAMVATAALTTAFGAFPGLLWDWGVLYPNVTGYAMIPAMMALVVRLLDPAPALSRVRDGLLLLLVTCGVLLAHPNAFLAGFLFGGVLAVGLAFRVALERRDRSSWLTASIIAALFIVAFIVLWHFARTAADHSTWKSFQTLPQAVGQALLVSPQGYAPTIVVVLLIVATLVAVARRPSAVPLLMPFATACLLYVAVSGFTTENPVRLYLTNPWYSDPNRFAALLPIVAVPALAFGASWIVELVRRRIDTSRLDARARRTVGTGAAALGVLLLCTLPLGSSVTSQLTATQDAYRTTGVSLLSADERVLLDRLDAEVPDDALIIGSPRTGASLAYAIADREVTEKHVFGDISSDESFLNMNLRDIDEDPAVCAAVQRSGVDFVLDFGSLDLYGQVDPADYEGIVNLEPSAGLELVDAVGDARLFKIEGC